MQTRLYCNTVHRVCYTPFQIPYCFHHLVLLLEVFGLVAMSSLFRVVYTDGPILLAVF